jgi:hypothetical protein
MTITPEIDDYKYVKVAKVDLFQHLIDEFSIPANWNLEDFTEDEDDSTYFLLRFKVV